eukprot:3136078-Lingulodinium_polyedra.AAC.1
MLSTSLWMRNCARLLAMRTSMTTSPIPIGGRGYSTSWSTLARCTIGLSTTISVPCLEFPRSTSALS